MKLLVLSALALVLQACVSNSPTTYESIRPAEYYAENDEYQDALGGYAPDVSFNFSHAAYYPWWSMDYFYLGSHAYRPGYWPGSRNSLAFRFGYPAGYWSYYGFYSPFYYPYSTYAWYDPWYGWPRYGIGTNLFWREYSAWTYNNSSQSRSRDSRYGSSSHGTSLYPDYRNNTDAFYDPRDRSGTRPANGSGAAMTSATRTGTMQVRSRTDTKIRQSRTGSTATVARPGVSRQPSRTASRPVVTTPRPSPVPRSGSSSSVRNPNTGKKQKR